MGQAFGWTPNPPETPVTFEKRHLSGILLTQNYERSNHRKVQTSANKSKHTGARYEQHSRYAYANIANELD